MGGPITRPLETSERQRCVKFSTLVDVLRWRALHQADRRAYTFLVNDGEKEISLSYGELDRRARAIGVLLQQIGAAGEHVLLLYPPGLEYIAAFFGCLYAGGIAVPSYPPRLNRPDSRLRAIVSDAQATVALATTHILSNAERRFAHTPELGSLHWLATDTLANDSSANSEQALAEEWRDPAITGETLAFLQYTSGSTAAPKGVMVSHENILHNERMIQQAFGLTEQSTVVGWLPVYHDMGLIGNVLQPLYAGSHCVLMSPMDFLQQPLRWLKAISHYQAHTSGGPNFAYDICVRKIAPEQRAPLDLSSWEVAFNGAEPVRHQTLERFATAFAPCGFRREAFYPCYGLAEATLFVSGGLKSAPPVLYTLRGLELERDRIVMTTAGDKDGRTLVGCGRTWSDQEIVVVDPESSTRRPSNRIGEIWVRGPNVARGYWNRPDETEHSFRAYLADTGEGPFLRTGDLGFLRDGELFITGRIKDLIIIRGRNHYPQDIELTVVESHPALRSGCGAAFSVDVDDEERLVIAQELERDHRKADVDEVARAIRQAVAENHELQVHAVVLLKPTRIPKTSSGKIRRRACRAAFLAGGLDAIGVSVLDDVPPSPDADALSRDALLTETLLAMPPRQRHQLLERYLRKQVARSTKVPLSRLDTRQPLSTLGLDSLMAVELRHNLETDLGVLLPVETLLQTSSIAQLATHVADRLATPERDSQTWPILPVSRDGELLLSFAQQRLWFLDQLEPGNPAYNLPVVVRLGGRLDVAALINSVNEIVRRHQALRTTFTTVNGRPTQVIAPLLTVNVPLVDIGRLPRDERDTEARRLIAEEAKQPFDLTRGPLLRVTLLRVDEEEHLFLLTMSHIVSDGWSMGVFGRELAMLYGAFSTGKPSPLPELSIQYADFAHWQRHWLQDEVLDTQITYWKQQLDADLPPLDLPTAHPRPAIQTFRGTRQSLLLSRDLTGALKTLSRQQECTLFMTLLAAFKIVLHRYSGQDDIVVGSPVAGRNRARTSELIGFFLNTLVLRTDLSGDPTFLELLERTRQVALEAFANQDVPFERVLEELRPQRDLSHTPLFQVFFNMFNFPHKEPELPGLTAELVPPPEAVALFDLTLYVEEQDENIKLDLVYNTDLYDRAQMTAMLEQLDHLLAQIVKRPKERIAQYSLVTTTAVGILPDPVETLNSDWVGSVYDKFSHQARRVPERLAVVDSHGAWTYEELDARGNQLANYLHAHGIQPRDVVAVYGHRSGSLAWALLGVLKAGAAFTILDPAYPASRLIDCLRQAEPRGWIQLDAAGSLPRALEDFASSLPCRLELSRRAAPGLLVNHSTHDPGVAVGADDLAYVAFTSGSTGRPKGILGTHRPLAHFLQWHHETFGLDQSDRFSMLSGLAHDPLLRDIFTPLWLGATLYIPDPENMKSPDWLVGWMKDKEINVIHLTPAVGQLLAGTTRTLTTATDKRPVLPSLRYAFFGGDVLTRRDVARLHELAPSVTCVNFYGTTETPQAMGYFVVPGHNVPPDGRLREIVPLGHGIEGAQLLVLSTSRQLAGVGEVGEIVIRTPYLTRGYVGDDALTRERFITNREGGERGGDRQYRTGDLGRYLPDGNVEFLGRDDHQVKLRGFRIELQEVEAVLGQHPTVREAVVAAQDTGRLPGDKQLVAYVLPAPDQTPTVGVLGRFLREKLPDYMVPSILVVLDALPLTPNGKVERRALPRPQGFYPGTEAAYTAPRTRIERTVATVWQEALGVEKVGIHDNFFDLGGHSLLLAQVQSRLQTMFDRDVPMVKMFQYPTISALAEYLNRQQGEQLSLQQSHDRAQARKKAIKQHRRFRQQYRATK